MWLPHDLNMKKKTCIQKSNAANYRLVSVFLGNKMLFDVSRAAEIADQHSCHVQVSHTYHSKCLIYRKDLGVIGYDLNQGFPYT